MNFALKYSMQTEQSWTIRDGTGLLGSSMTKVASAVV